MKFLLPVLVSAGTLAAARAATITFGSPAELAEFSLNGAAASTFTFNATAGVGGGGGVVSTSSAFNTDAAIYRVGSPNTVGGSFAVSLDYQMQFGSPPDLRVGFVTAPTGNFTGSNDAWAECFGAGNPKSLYYYSAPSGFVALGTVGMTAGNWARLEFALTKTAATTYTGTVTLWDLGGNGLAAPALLSMQGIGFTSAPLGAAAELFPGFYLQNVSRAADNFTATSVLPEPSAAWLLALGGLGSALGCRPARSARRVRA